jgi:hypothetical protein
MKKLIKTIVISLSEEIACINVTRIAFNPGTPLIVLSGRRIRKVLRELILPRPLDPDNLAK